MYRNNESDTPWQVEPEDVYYNNAGFHITELAILRAFKNRDHAPPFTFNDFQMKGKAGRSVPWHPSPTGHKFRGEALAWNYLWMWEKAARRVLEKPVELALPPLPPLPGVWLCDPGICNQTVKRCLTSYKPRSEKSGPSLLGTMRAGSKWKHVLSPADVEAATYNQGAGLGYLDYKMVLLGKQEDGWLSLDMPIAASPAESSGKIMMCSPSTGWRQPEDQGVMIRHAEVRVSARGGNHDSADSRPILLLSNFSMIVKQTHTQFPWNPMCTKLTETLPQGGFRDVAGGMFSIHMRVKPGLNFTSFGSTPETFYLALSQVIIW